MSRISSILIIFFLTLFLISGCGSDNSSEAKSIIKKQAGVTEDYVTGLTNAKNSDDVVEAIANYTEGMKKLIPDLKEFQKKYPEFQQGKMPDGMEEEAERLQEAAAKFPGAMMKSASFMMDDRVQEAMTKMAEEMSKLQ